jgi:hypothetical protein
VDFGVLGYENAVVRSTQKMMAHSSILMVTTYDTICFSMALAAHSGPRTPIQFRNYFSQTVGPFGRVISPSQCRYLNTGQHKHRINAYTHQTFMPWMGFESTIPASERAKTVHALDRAATMNGTYDTIRCRNAEYNNPNSHCSQQIKSQLSFHYIDV